MNDIFENIDIKTAEALAGSEALTSMLADGAGSIYHDDAPDDGVYPILVYTTISEVPAMNADNGLYAWQKVVRVTVIDNTQTRRHAFKEAIYKAMKQAGFAWQMTNTMKNINEYYLIMDFLYAELSTDYLEV